jgi:hypothetical protein
MRAITEAARRVCINFIRGSGVSLLVFTEGIDVVETLTKTGIV